MATIQDIKQRAQQVKDATQIGENTANRVGGVLVDMADHLEDDENQLSSLYPADAVPTAGSTKPVQSGSVHEQLSQLLPMDAVPTPNSVKPVQSGGVYENTFDVNHALGHINKLIGKGLTVYSITITPVPEHVYQLEMLDTDWEIEGIPSGYSIFYLAGYNGSAYNNAIDQILSQNWDTQKPSSKYVFRWKDNISTNGTLRLGIRAAVGVEVRYRLTDVTTDYKDAVVGINTGYTSIRYDNLIRGHKYRVSLKNTEWQYDKTSGGANTAKFNVDSFVDETNYVNLVKVAKSAALNDTYEFTVPEDSSIIKIGGRANNGEVIRFQLEDVTDIENLVIADNFEANKMFFTPDGATWNIVDEPSWCITDYFPYNAGDIIDSKFMMVGRSRYLIVTGYDINKNPIRGKFFSSADYKNERTDMIFTNNSNVKYVRFAVSLNNIRQCEIKINDKVVWSGSVKIEDKISSIEGQINSIEGQINKGSKKLIIGNIVQGSVNSSGIIDSSRTNRVCQECVTSLPCVPCSMSFKLPDNLKVVILSGTAAGANSITHNSGWLYNGGTYIFPSNDIFYNLIFANSDATTEILPSTVLAYIDSGEIEVYYENNDLDIIERNVDTTKYAKAATLNLLSGQIQTGDMLNKMPIFAHISDLHGDFTRYLNCIEYAKYFKVDSVLVSGDSVPYHYGNGNSWLKDGLKKYNVNMLTCIGNHEVWHSQTGNNDIIFRDYIEPFVESNGYLKDENTPAEQPYYYKDFPEKQMRIIVLNQYDCSIYGGQGRGGRLGQEQITWFVNTLNLTPIGYGVIIMMHAYEAPLEKPQSLSEFNQKVFVGTYMNNGFYVNTIRPIMKIVDAFISKATISFTYTEVNSSGTTQDADTISVVADFTNVDASTEFICYLCGHRHEDVVGYYSDANNPQLVITVTSGTAHYGTSSAHSALANQEDLPRGTHGPTQDAFNIYAIDRINKVVKIARIGSNMTFQLEDRKYMVASYIDRT